jgi:hypothetical protein
MTVSQVTHLFYTCDVCGVTTAEYQEGDEPEGWLFAVSVSADTGGSRHYCNRCHMAYLAITKIFHNHGYSARNSREIHS